MPDDDDLDGCELDFSEDATHDDDVAYVALFAGATSKAEARKLAKQYQKLWGKS